MTPKIAIKEKGGEKNEENFDTNSVISNSQCICGS